MIPKSFQLLGHAYSVELVEEDDWEDDDAVGKCLHNQYRILIRARQSDEARQHTFCHELIHAILGRMGEDDLDADEQFVDVMGSLLHQAWTTVK